MEMRTSKPKADNKFYLTVSKGGYSKCIKGSPTDECDVLANCVGYACGRFNEIIGEMKYPTLYCNAENFIERAKSLGLQVVNYPTLGGIMVWQKGSTLNSNDGAGHVAIVERIDSDIQIYTSESGYGTKAFWNATRTNKNGRWGAGSGYTFRGCIVNPTIGDVHYEEPQPIETNTSSNNNSINMSNTDLLDLVRKTIRGDFGNGETRKKKLGSNYDEVQKQVNANIKAGLTSWNNIKLF